MGKGAVLLMQKRYQEARDCSSMATQLAPRSVGAWLNLGRAFFHQGDKAEALAKFDHALAIEPSNDDARGCRIDALVALKKYDEALTDIAILQPRRPDDLSLVEHKSSCLLCLERPREAMDSIETLIRAAPNVWSAHTMKGIAYDQLGDHVGALVHHAHALKLSPEHPIACYYKAACHVLRDEPDDGLALLKVAFAGEPSLKKEYLMEKLFAKAHGDERFADLAK
jgi:Flp pilus assembly protein TadD